MKYRFSSKIKIALLALSHGVTDSYANFPAALSKNLVDKLSISYANWGMLVSLQSISNSMSQIIFGYFADKFGRGIFVVLGPIFACVFLSLIGVAPNYAILAVLILIGGFGVASFHPQGAAIVGKLAERRRGFGVSIFSFGGSVGFALGPLIATGIVAVYGLAGTPLAMSWGFIMPLALYLTLYRESVMESAKQKNEGKMSLVETIRPNFRVLFLLFLIVVFRAGTSTVFVNFLRLFLEDWNLSEIASGGIISIYLVAGSIGGLIGGALSDRISRKGILIFSLCVATPFLWQAVHSTSAGGPFLVYLFLAGFILTSSTPINIVMAQEMMPRNASTASSFMMGLGWGFGGLLSYPFGLLADFYGPPDGVARAMSWLAFIPLLTTIFAILLPDETRRLVAYGNETRKKTD